MFKRKKNNLYWWVWVWVWYCDVSQPHNALLYMVNLYTHSRICRTAMDVLTIKYCGLIKLPVLHCHWLVFWFFFFYLSVSHTVHCVKFEQWCHWWLTRNLHWLLRQWKYFYSEHFWKILNFYLAKCIGNILGLIA